MIRRALVTLNIGNRDEAVISKPFFYGYCQRHNLDFVVIHERRFHLTPNRRRPRLGIHLEKFQIAELFDYYDRIAYLDSDVLIHSEAPDLFAQVAPDEIGCVFEDVGPDAWKRDEEWQKAEALLGPLEERHRYFNAGVMVFGRAHRELFNLKLGLLGGRWPDQTFLNYHSRQLGMTVKELPQTFNFLPIFHGWEDPAVRAQQHFVHYAGRKNKPHMKADARMLLDRVAQVF
ncbi:MAG: hypothetical protein GVY36_09925 [Verrucomicrobia bacterium]|jgi:lipopolysaccharide biosynthesis glycosyltransferase|nr:hypothetical protein [Verrucomicrobiota bacterium]